MLALAAFVRVRKKGLILGKNQKNLHHMLALTAFVRGGKKGLNWQ